MFDRLVFLFRDSVYNGRMISFHISFRYEGHECSKLISHMLYVMNSN